jgi:serine/threonine protein kinase/tetratricopeptide (TPR) repeat protein
MTEPSLPEESIFAQALDMPSAERAAFLDRACGANVGLRAEVEALLRAHERSGDLLDLPERLPTTADLPAPERPGAVLGPYKLLEQIGEGGMGSVWLAEQTDPIQRRVALKVVKEGMDSRQVLARFEAERQALALMEHPHIARVFDAGRTPAGRPYFVMELVKGRSITKYCDEKCLGLRERLGLFADVCRAVQHAHQKGIIHRDLKPSNVLVAGFDGKAVVKVIDFGVAKATGQRLTGQTLFTGFGAVVGTPEHMSPEQAEVNNQDIDTRSDIYSLGVLLYELLTGSTPLTRKRLKEAPILEVLRVIREEEPPRPSTRLAESNETLPTISARRQTEPAKLTKQVRGELDWIVMKALEKDRNRRYETANSFAQDIERYLADEPVLACPPSALYRLRKFARRNKGKLTAAAGALLALAVMAGSIGWAVRDRQEREAEKQRVETARLDQVAGKARESWHTARTLLAENKLATARQQLAQAQAQLGSDRTALADLAAEVEAAAAEVERYQQFLSLIERAHEAETAPFTNPALLTAALGDNAGATGPAAPSRQRPADTVALLRKALAQYGVLERKDWSTALAGRFLGSAQVEQVRRLAYEELILLADDLLRRQQDHRSGARLSAATAARAALVYLAAAEKARQPTQVLYVLRAECRKAVGEEAACQADWKIANATPPTIGLDHYRRGLAEMDRRQPAEAIQAFEAALQLEPTHYWSMMHLGYVLAGIPPGKEDFAGAARVFSACLMTRPDHVNAYLLRASMYSRLSRFQEALADSSRAIKINPKQAMAWNTRADIYRRLGQDDKALAAYSQAIAIDATFAPAWNDRGALYLTKLGQPEKAIDDFTQALKRDASFALAWLNRASAYHKLGQPDKALADYTQATRVAPLFALVWNERGKLYAELGRHEEVIADLSRFLELAPPQLPLLVQAYLLRANASRQLGHFAQVLKDYQAVLKLVPGNAVMNDHLAWLLATCPEASLRDPSQAVERAREAVAQAPQEGKYWQTLGVAHYRAGDWKAAAAALEKSVALQKGGDAGHAFFLAMTYQKLGNAALARQQYDRAAQWMRKNNALLSRDRMLAAILRRFQAEAEEVLELKK